MSNRNTQAVTKKNQYGVTTAVSQQELPLPYPAILKEYANILPSSPERLLCLTEQNQKEVATAARKAFQNSIH